ncbi:MAG: glycoside hydrolase family 127 protein [Firmicutes bacterium]|nr:glycoside hydrolase family 127 protein [Bacillota bacterium]
MKVQVNQESFWGRYMEVVRTSMLPYQWEALNDRIADAEPSGCIHNFRVAAGLEQGEFYGKVFQDSDLAKWLEAASYSLMYHPDPKLEAQLDEVIGLIEAAQQPDGYLDTYYIINGLDKRFTNLRDNHELYCAGHMLEAAVAHYHATGKRKLLDVMIRYVDLIYETFGPEENQLHGYPGHEEIELALMKLYDITQDPRHLALAKYFIDQRGQQPLYFAEEKNHDRPFRWEGSYGYQYHQAGLPVREQTEAEGHAVRAVYLYSGMADVARVTGDDSLLQALDTIWKNMTRRRMYITGAIGSSHWGEAFTYDYHLPNDTVYGETCAAVGLVFLARRMLMIRKRSEYADVMERALYNGVISGMTLDGKRFFYVNPLEVEPEACAKDYEHFHVKPVRQKWFGCACCPPNLARLICSLPEYMLSEDEDGTYLHLYMDSEVRTEWQGTPVSLRVETDYPWDGAVKITASPEEQKEWTLALRVPGWCRRYTIRVNGEDFRAPVECGYARITRTFSKGDTVEIVFDMPVTEVAANPLVREDAGKLAVTRGPLVYCLEEADNGAELHRVRLPEGKAADVFTVTRRPEMLGGIVALEAPARIMCDRWEELYRPAEEESFASRQLTWIPYYAWANREKGEMMVWIRR